MVTANYSYDTRHRLTGLDRRIAKAVDADGAGPGTAVTTRFAYDGEHILLQFDETALAQRYLHGPVIDQILAAEDVSTLTTPGSLLWPLADHQGTIRDLVDSTGSVLNHLKYDAFGRVTSETNAAVDFLFAYTGRERDEETGLYYYRARYYDPAVGRFVSEDPIGFLAGDVNVSRYVGNSTMNARDPTGLVTLTFGGEIDGFLGPAPVPVGGGGSVQVQIHIGFSLRHKPFFTFGTSVGTNVRAGIGWGIGSIELGGAITTAPNVETIVSQNQYHAGISTPIVDIDYIRDHANPPGMERYKGIAIATGPGAEFHAHQGLGASKGAYTTNQPSEDWVWPWDHDASWNPVDTLNLWFIGK